MTTHDQAVVVNDTMGVLNNDSGWEDSGSGGGSGSTLTASVVTGPTHGSLALNSDGSFTYTPTAGYTGSDSFTYNANYDGLSEEATVSLSVVNHPPEFTMPSMVSIPESLLNGDFVEVATATDPDNDPLLYSLSDPSGIFTIDSTTGVITIANEDNLVGGETYAITVNVTDGFETDSAVIDVNVVASMWKITSPTATGETLDATEIKIKGKGTAGEAKTLLVTYSVPGVGGISPKPSIVKLVEIEVTADADGNWEYLIPDVDVQRFKKHILSIPSKKGPLKMNIVGTTARVSSVYRFTPP